jgi:iron complex outermembrane receptor protein
MGWETKSAAMVVAACGIAIAAGPRAEGQEPIRIPQITVNAPSPIQRAPLTEEAPLQGTLPIVTDQFATVTVVPAEEIKRNGGATLGDLLANKPGITGSGFAPGAASRPAVRGLDMNRVRIQENGIGSGGASELGEDHGIPIDPLSVRQVEVIRGPATLRWGSQAIGGVVNADNNRIPTMLPPRGFISEWNGAFSSVDGGLEGAVLLDAGKGNFAVHADAYGRTALDYRVPSYPYLFDPTQPFGGRQRNSRLHANGQAIGASYLFGEGFIGIAVSQFASVYHIPTIEAAERNVRIDMKQTKVTGKGEYRPSGSLVDAIRFWLGHTDYKHNEVGLEGPTDVQDIIHQTFTNREWEGRIEAQITPISLRFATLTGALGVQVSHQRLTASSPEEPGSILNGLFDPNRSTMVAGYLFNEFKLSSTLRAQIAGRIEFNRVTGREVFIPSTAFDIAALTPSTARERNFWPASVSFGLLQDLPWNMVGSVTAQHVERAPRAPELFSRGVHEATGTFDIGNPNLGIETASSIEAGVRRAKGPLRFEAMIYYTWFGSFIFRQLTNVQCNETSCGQGVGDEELKQALYAQRDAIFRGGEVQFQWDVQRIGNGFFGIDGQYDIVRATFADGTNVPRIPPQRLGGGVFWRNEEWFVRVGLLHAFAQNQIGAFESAGTPGYNLLKAEISRTAKFKNDPSGARQVAIGVVGTNLLNEEIRNAVAFTKYEVLAPGASVRVFANISF